MRRAAAPPATQDQPSPSPSPFAVARARVGDATRESKAAMLAMLGMVDEVESPHDDVAELMGAITVLGEQYRELRGAVEARVLEWLRRNDGRVREVRVGDMKWWGEKEKSVRCLEVGAAGAAAFRALHWTALLELTFGDEEAAQRVLALVRDLFRSVVSSGGLKEGATRDVLQAAAEAEVRAMWEADPASVPTMGAETPEAALARAVEAARVASYIAHFEETWPDKVKGGDPATRLGVANLRFVHRVAGGTKKELDAMDRAAMVAQMGGD